MPHPDTVEVYSAGLVCCSACAPVGMDRGVVEERVNRRLPTGIASRWRISDDASFATGETNPCPCPADPGRQHWLLNC